MSNSGERRARQALLHAGEPGDRALARWVAERGVIEAVARLGAGDGPQPDGRHSLRVRSAQLDRESERAAALGARLVCPGDEEWPDFRLAGLGTTSCPPYALWVRGARSLAQTAQRAVAVVGSRASTAYGDHVTVEISSGLADRDWTVVSGAAYGIDGAAHRACLAVGGITLAVLAGGVDDAYPKGHSSLLARIAGDGLVVSELPLGQSPSRSRFLERNRLIAALGAGTVAVEMALRSGARNTLEHAHALLRPVMAVPGPVTSAMSEGCNAMIGSRQAELVTDAGDIIRVVAPIGECEEPVRRGVQRATDRLAPDVLAVYEALPPVNRVALDDLERLAGLPRPTIGEALRELLRAGLVDVSASTVSRSRPTRRVGP